LSRQRFGRFGLMVVIDHDGCAGSGQRFGGGVADAGAGTGDQCHLAGEGYLHAGSRLE